MSSSSFFAPLWKATIAKWLNVIETDELRIVFPDGDSRQTKALENSGSASPLTVTFHDWGVIPGLLFGGQLRLAEDYLDGKWTTSNLADLIEVGAHHEHLLPQVSFIKYFKQLRQRMWHRGNANTLDGSKRNIAYHYDLGNDFYAEWLDETMTYSSAYFDSGANSLSAAQTQKYERLAKSIGLVKEDHVLEIGCGWGGFAEYAASTYGCRITCLTLSEEQATFARKRMADKGLASLVDIRLQDYREVDGTFDKIVSIEMFEAVGEENWQVYFKTLVDRLRPKGRAALQIITINDEGFESYRRHVDFIQRYIFPGGMLPSPKALADQVARQGLKMVDTLFFGRSYARTLGIWHDKFMAAWPKIAPLGFDDRFKRMWTFYLAYCEGGFRAGKINVGHFILEKPA